LGIKPQALRAVLSHLKIYWKIVLTGSRKKASQKCGAFYLLGSSVGNATS